LIARNGIQRALPSRDIVESIAFGRSSIAWQPGKTTPVQGVTQTVQSLVTYYWQRQKQVLDMRTMGDTWAICTLWSEVAAHLAFLVSLWFLVATTEHEEEEQIGSFIKGLRHFLTVVTAAYSGMFVGPFFCTVQLSDGALRYAILLSLLLLVLPVVACLEIYLIVAAWSETRWHVALAKARFYHKHQRSIALEDQEPLIDV